MSEPLDLLPTRFATSLMLHCWRYRPGAVVWHTCRSTLAPDACGVPASRHRPDGWLGFCEDTRSNSRFPAYAQVCDTLPASHSCTVAGVAVAGSPEPASMQRSL